MRRVVVITSENEVADPDELATAHRVGAIVGESGGTLLFDDAQLGPLITVADACREAGGRLIGVTTETAGQRRPDLTEARTVASKGDLRIEMAALAEGWIFLPKASATLARVFETAQVGGASDRGHPVGLLDFQGYYSNLLRAAEDDTVDLFVRESQRGRIVMSRDPDDLFKRLKEFRAPETRREEGLRDDD